MKITMEMSKGAYEIDIYNSIRNIKDKNKLERKLKFIFIYTFFKNIENYNALEI